MSYSIYNLILYVVLMTFLYENSYVFPHLSICGKLHFKRERQRQQIHSRVCFWIRFTGLGSLGLKFGFPSSSRLPGFYILHLLLPDLNFSFHKCPHCPFSSLATHAFNITIDSILYIAGFHLPFKEYV